MQNNLSGCIPAELGMLKELQLLGLGSNKLTGRIPNALANCTSLTEFGLYMNNLSGLIPVELGMLKKLQLLYLWDNQLTGGIPKALRNCTSLTDLELVRNDLSGPIPVEFGMLKELNTLYLWSNQLTGEIPYALRNCTSLIDLQVWDNNLSGRIPPELGMSSSCRLQTLSAGSNGLSGAFPPTLANCTALVALSIGSNSLSGNIPADVFNSLSSLGVLDLSDNSFSGVLPRSIGGLKNLYKLHLQGNALVGTIPNNFLSSAPFLASLDISRNNLSGLIPESFGKLLGLVKLHLSHNHLSGKIPSSLGSFPQLVSLDLSWNALSGGIPASLHGALQLQSLNLSHNKLTGSLPASFASLQSLLLLNLSYNQLEGPIPDTFPYGSTSSTLVDLRGNPFLCGEAMNHSCTTTIDQGTSEHSKLFISVAGAFCLVGLSMIGIVIIWHHRSKHSQQSNLNNAFRADIALRVSAEELQIATHGFSEDCILGQGGSSIVYRGILAGHDVAVAIKVLKSAENLQTITKAQVVRSRREVEVLARLRHRNIVKVLGCCFNLDLQAIILELMPNGNLDTYLHGTSRQNAVSKEENLRVLRGIAQGLEYLHHWHDPRRSIVHCDVKPANILLDEDWEPRIADFGIAKLLQHSGSNIQAQQDPTSVLLRGSIGYIPPEYAFNAEVSTAGDVYSFGIVMLEVLTGKRPTDIENETGGKHDTLMSLVQAAYPANLVPLFTDESSPGMSWDVEEAQKLARMALSCTYHYPLQRPTMAQVRRFLSDMTHNPSTLSSWSSLIQ